MLYALHFCYTLFMNQQPTALLLAKAFLNKSVCDGRGITLDKLQKLLFFAQEEHLHRCRTPLFEDVIEASLKGPVITEVTSSFAHYGSEIISEVHETVHLDAEAQHTVAIVWEHYGVLDEWFLAEVMSSYTLQYLSSASEISTQNVIHKKDIRAFKLKIEAAKREAEERAHQKMDAFFDLHDIEE